VKRSPWFPLGAMVVVRRADETARMVQKCWYGLHDQLRVS